MKPEDGIAIEQYCRSLVLARSMVALTIQGSGALSRGRLRHQAIHKHCFEASGGEVVDAKDGVVET